MANYDPLSFTVLVDSSGVAAASAKIYYYETGSTTPKAVYSNAGLTSAITQPVTCDSLGVMPVVYLSAGRYKRAVTTSSGTTLSAYAADPIDASQELIAASAAPSTTYPFLRYHNTSDGHVYRRDSTNASWIDEGAVDSLGNAATVTQQLAGTATSAFSTPDSVSALWQRGTDIASAATLSLPSTGGGVFNVTGTTGVTGIGSASGGRKIKLKFAAALTITHNATSLILPGAANITTVAGDCAEFINEAAQDATGSNWRCFSYDRASGSPLNFTDQLATQANMETATSTTTIVTPGRVIYNPGVAKASGSFSFSGSTQTNQNTYGLSSATDAGVGLITHTFATAFSTAYYICTGMCQRVNTNDALWPAIRNAASHTPSTTSVTTATVSDGAATSDPTLSQFAFFGDQ